MNLLQQTFTAAIFCAVCTLSASGQSQPRPAATAVEPWTKIPIPPLHDFHPVQPKRIELANGMVLFLQVDHELPFINGFVLIRGGSRDEPAAKVGLVSLYGQTWRTSGTASASGEMLDDQLALKAATIETTGGPATTSIHWSSFAKDFDTVFGQAVDLLLHPAFKADKLAMARSQLQAGIARRNDDAGDIAGREASFLVYGKSSPYARQVEYASVDAVQLADLTSWHQRTVSPNNMILAVSGDFDPAAMEAKLRAAFEPLKPGPAMPKLNTSFTDPKPGVYFVNKPDVDQSNIYIVGLGTERNNPDFYALSVMNDIFSGGFGSRVLQSVRTRLGLAYSVGGSYGASYDHPGMFTVAAASKSASTVAATQAMLDEIGRLKTMPPTAAEMKRARDQVLNSFIFNYDSPDKTLSEQVVLALYGYPSDFLDKYKTGVEKVTSEDVTRVANKYIDVNKLAIVVVGNSAEFGGPLTPLGPVTNLDIAIPPPPEVAKPSVQ